MYKLLMPPRKNAQTTIVSAVPTDFEYNENGKVIVISQLQGSALYFISYTYLNDQRENAFIYSFGKDREILDALCHSEFVYFVIRVKKAISGRTQFSWSFVEVPISDMDEFKNVSSYRVINNAATVLNKSKILAEVKGTFENGVSVSYSVRSNKFTLSQGDAQLSSTVNRFKDVIIVAPSLEDLNDKHKKITPSDICALVLLRLLDQYQNATIVHYTLGMDLTKASVIVGLPSDCAPESA